MTYYSGYEDGICGRPRNSKMAHKSLSYVRGYREGAGARQFEITVKATFVFILCLVVIVTLL